jgi:phosphatidylglycerol:prolipoprotein diacylglycerol transferase
MCVVHFPVVYSIGGLSISAHLLFEVLGYGVAYAVYRWLRKNRNEILLANDRLTVIAGAAVGALAGSRLLALLDGSFTAANFLAKFFSGSSGKTIVGGLLGGWIGVEIAKRLAGIRVNTGDILAVPICCGIAIGRVGCFLAGLSDDTYGLPTRLPWGINFGDGVYRHPTQLYEVLFVSILGFVLWKRMALPYRNGNIFRIFLASYLMFRIAVDFLKPGRLELGMTIIQWACCLGLIVLLLVWSRDGFAKEGAYVAARG